MSSAGPLSEVLTNQSNGVSTSSARKISSTSWTARAVEVRMASALERRSGLQDNRILLRMQ